MFYDVNGRLQKQRKERLWFSNDEFVFQIAERSTV